MGRRRNSRADGRLPPYVYRRHRQNLVELRRYLGDGKFGPSCSLRDDDGNTLPANASQQAIMRAYGRAVHVDNAPHTLAWMLKQYMSSPRFARLAKATQGHYRGYAARICAFPLNTGALFGDVPIGKITRPVIARYRDARSSGAKAAPIAVNREMQFLSAVWSWAMEQGYATDNPAQGVEKNPQKSRDRYVTDAEYALVLGLAPAWLAAAMELAYLCRARIGEVLALTRDSVLDEGVHLKRTKGSDSEITRWSPRLRDAVALAKSHNRDTISRFLLHDAKGGKIRSSAYKSAWQRLMVRARKAGLSKAFPFHDLKARGYTDHGEHAAGHRSARMHEVYMRLPEMRDATR